MSTYAHFFRKRNKNLVDVLVQIESGTKVALKWHDGKIPQINYDKHEKGDKRLSLFLLGL